MTDEALSRLATLLHQSSTRMNPPPGRSFWREFWPKALILAFIVAGLWLLEHFGYIRRW